MNVFFSGLFFLSTVLVFGNFFRNLWQTWSRLKAVGAGTEENRLAEPSRRLTQMLLGGFLQKRMFKDPIPGIMHFQIGRAHV